jgi:hypothetical protein
VLYREADIEAWLTGRLTTSTSQQPIKGEKI